MFEEAEDDSDDDFDKLLLEIYLINMTLVVNSVSQLAACSAEFNVPSFSHPRQAHDDRNARLSPSRPEPSPRMENRCKRSEPGKSFPQTSMDNDGPVNETRSGLNHSSRTKASNTTATTAADECHSLIGRKEAGSV